ncbi:Bro-N domain-containing protein [Candidatus Enterenecus avicola]
METPQIFSFENNQFRTILVNDEPYFVGEDVADILGYANGPKAMRDYVDEEYKLTERIVMADQTREEIIFNESGLYTLILKSKLPSAKKFKRWVTSEVLPIIRKAGSYMNVPRSFAEALRLAAD